jgi:aryl-alcohol dehydrogenase-like predicted oxidoreductase
LGGGVLTGKYNKSNREEQQQTQQQNTLSSSSTTVVAQEGNSRLEVQNEFANRVLNDRNMLIAQEVSKIAKEIGCSAAQVALNWVRQQI